MTEGQQNAEAGALNPAYSQITITSLNPDIVGISRITFDSIVGSDLRSASNVLGTVGQ